MGEFKNFHSSQHFNMFWLTTKYHYLKIFMGFEMTKTFMFIFSRELLAWLLWKKSLKKKIFFQYSPRVFIIELRVEVTLVLKSLESSLGVAILWSLCYVLSLSYHLHLLVTRTHIPPQHGQGESSLKVSTTGKKRIVR